MKSNGKATKRKNSDKFNKQKLIKDIKNDQRHELPEKPKQLIKENGKQTQNDKQKKFGPLPSFSYQRVFARMTVIMSVMIIVWYTSKDKNETVLAARKEVISQRGQAFPCSTSFQNEIVNFPGCIPKKCGRYVTDKLVTNSEAETLLKLAKNGLALGSAEGGASILDLHSGALTHGTTFVNIYSLENVHKFFSSVEMAVYKVVKTKIQHAIAQNFGLDTESLYLTHPTFFSKLTNKEPKTIHDEYWHPHVDKETYKSFHYTSLLYLSDYENDFTGGRLIFIDQKSNVTIEPRKGRIAMFSSGEENVHFVERVQTGNRFAITVSFTCDSDKSVPDPMMQFKKHTNEAKS